MYITTREMVISIICNACGVLGLILWAIEAHKANAIQYIQRIESVESVGNNDDIIVRSNLEPFRVDEPQTERIRKCIDCRLVSECRYTNPDSVICERFWQKERSE